MSGTASFIVLAEDLSGARFVESYLRERGVTNHEIRTLVSPGGHGSGKQWVTQRFPIETADHRAKSGHTRKALLVCSDADELAAPQRLDDLLGTLTEPRQPAERIALLIPKWEIETWAEHLLRGGAMSEDAKMGWDTERSRRECSQAGRALHAHRHAPAELPTCCPSSLVASDPELKRL